MSGGSLTPGFIPIRLTESLHSEGETTGCAGCIPTPPDPDEEMLMLYPTSHDIDSVVGSEENPVPLLGGVILKIPAPGQVNASKQPDKIAAILEFLTSKSAFEKLELTEKEKDGESLFGYTDKLPGPAYKEVSEAKMAVNNAIISLAETRPALVGDFDYIKDLRIIMCSTTIEDISKIAIGEDVGPDRSNLKECFELTYIPIEILAGKGVSITAKFGEKFKHVYGVCGNTYDFMATYTSVSDHSGDSAFEGETVATQDSKDKDAADAIMDSMGPNFDILALLAKLFNLDMFPINIEEILEKIAGELLELLPIEIEFLSMLGDPSKKAAVIAAIEGTFSDAQIRELLLEFLPIQNVPSSAIEAGTSPVTRYGFYTIYNDYIYMKLPDMSCMDSGGFSHDSFYKESEEEGGDPEIERFFFIEQHSIDSGSGKITRWGFKPKPPPMVELVGDLEVEFPDSEDVEILVSGVQGQGKMRYFLSPVADVSSKTKSNAFTVYDDGVELFTAPKITKFIFAPNETKNKGPYDDYKSRVSDAISSAIIGLRGKYGNMGDLLDVSVNSDFEVVLKQQGSEKSIAAEAALNTANMAMMGAFVAYELGDVDLANQLVNTANISFDAAAMLEQENDDLNIDVIDLGFPLSYVTDEFSGDRGVLLGEKNRSDIILSQKSGKTTDGDIGNNKNYIKKDICGNSIFFASNRPRFCGSPHIPSEIWIEGEDTETKDDEGNIKVKFKADHINTKFKKRNVRFALYALDSMGQLVRAPNSLLSINGAAPSIDEVLPSGCVGGGRIKGDTFFSIRIEGSNLGNVEKVIFNSETATPIDFLRAGTDKYRFNAKEDSIQIVMKGDGISFASQGFSPGSKYTVTASSADGSSMEDVSVYISLDDEEMPECSSGLAFISHDSMKYPNFDSYIYGVPVYHDGSNNAQIQIKCKSKIFSGAYSGIHAYLAVHSSQENEMKLDSFCFDDDRLYAKGLDASGNELELIIVKTVEYPFSSSGMSEFYQKPGFVNTGKKAILDFPSRHSKLNFSSLLDIGEVFFVITNRQIDEYNYPENSLMDEGTYAMVRIGSLDEPFNSGFISSPRIVGAIATIAEKIEDGKSTFNTLSPEFDNAVSEYGFDKKDFVRKQIKTDGYISRLGLVFTGSKTDTKPKKSYSFFWGAAEDKKSKINKNMVGKISKLTVDGKNYYIAIFNNVRTSDIGKIGMFITHKDKIFNPSGMYSSQKLYFKATTDDIKIVASDIDSETNKLKISEPVEGLKDKLLSEPKGPVDTKVTLINNDGTEYYHVPVDVNSDVDIYLEGSKDGDAQKGIINIVGGESSSIVSIAGGTSIKIDANTEISPDGGGGAYFKNPNEDSARAVISLSISPNIPAYVMPEIYAMEINGVKWPDSVSSATELQWGKEHTAKIWARGAGLTEYWDITMDIPSYGPMTFARQGVRKIGPQNYVFSVKMPPFMELAFAAAEANKNGDNVDTTCIPKIYLSGTNAALNRAEEKLGPSVNLDFTSVMRGMIDGPNKDKRRTPGKFKTPILPPLNFCPLPLKFPAINPKLLQSLCDASFHLTAELKVHLEQFYILCIPIQVLLCIIDVICSLMNPFKVVLAIIRLFECLFDLLLLLPQISVPVMFLNLILHLLEILECILRKILWLIMAINALVIAFKNAVPINPDTGKVDARYVDWDAIQALEETISEYLFEMEADLDFLGPIMSILGLFLQLLQLLFRFPCRINMEGGDYICGMDGTLLGGLIRGKAMPGGPIDTNYLIPVGQSYAIEGSGQTWIPAGLCESNESGVYLPSEGIGDTYAEESIEDGTMLTNIIDEGTWEDDPSEDNGGTYRGRGPSSTSGGDLTFTTSITKSTTGFSFLESSPQVTTFYFKDTWTGFCLPPAIPFRSYIDPNRPGDSPLTLFDISEGTTLVSAANGNFISLHDGYEFLKSSSEDGWREIKPLSITFEWTEYSVDEETSEVVETQRSEEKTYDDIPSMTIVDGNGDVYFPTQVHFNDDGLVDQITARVINQDAAKMLTKSKDEKVYNQDEIDDYYDTCGEDCGGPPDQETYKEISYPQIMFFDMRQIEDEIEDLCLPAQMNSEAVPTEEPDEVIDIIEETNDCIEEFIRQVNEQRQGILDALGELNQNDWDEETQTWLDAPNIPEFDVDVFTLNGQALKDCLEDSVDKICKFVVNPLTTSFRVLEDEDIGSLGDLYRELSVGSTFSDGAESTSGMFPQPAITSEALSDASSDSYEAPEEEHISGARFIGAREFAEGIGDNAVIKAGDDATIQIVPRDIYNNPINERADLSTKIYLEIISDTTGDAELEKYTNDDGEESNLVKLGEVYQGKLTSGAPGVVKLRASVCNKTIKAFANSVASDASVDVDVDCIDDASEEDAATTGVGGVVKVDRILTILFTKDTASTIGAGDDASVAKPRPQTAGTKLEN